MGSNTGFGDWGVTVAEAKAMLTSTEEITFASATAFLLIVYFLNLHDNINYGRTHCNAGQIVKRFQFLYLLVILKKNHPNHLYGIFEVKNFTCLVTCLMNFNKSIICNYYHKTEL